MWFIALSSGPGKAPHILVMLNKYKLLKNNSFFPLICYMWFGGWRIHHLKKSIKLFNNWSSMLCLILFSRFSLWEAMLCIPVANLGTQPWLALWFRFLDMFLGQRYPYCTHFLLLCQVEIYNIFSLLSGLQKNILNICQHQTLLFTIAILKDKKWLPILFIFAFLG